MLHAAGFTLDIKPKPNTNTDDAEHYYMLDFQTHVELRWIRFACTAQNTLFQKATARIFSLAGISFGFSYSGTYNF